MALSGGVPSSRLNLDAFLEQGRAYREAEGLDKLSRVRAELSLTHSRPVKRVHELMAWVQSGDYDRIVSGDYVRRGAEPGWREEADSATEHYAERFRAIFREVGEGVSRAGDQLADATGKASGVAADAAERLGVWLRGGS
jgi:hypothetical protein